MSSRCYDTYTVIPISKMIDLKKIYFSNKTTAKVPKTPSRLKKEMKARERLASPSSLTSPHQGVGTSTVSAGDSHFFSAATTATSAHHTVDTSESASTIMSVSGSVSSVPKRGGDEQQRSGHVIKYNIVILLYLSYLAHSDRSLHSCIMLMRKKKHITVGYLPMLR